MHSSTVLTVWDGDRLIGLIRVLDDSEMLAQIHYVLVHPDYQGQDIAGEMLERIKENTRTTCISKGCQRTKRMFPSMKSTVSRAWSMVQPSRSATIPINDKHRTPILISECGLAIQPSPPLRIRSRTFFDGGKEFVLFSKEYKKSEPFPYRKKVRILLLWCTSRDSNPGPTD